MNGRFFTFLVTFTATAFAAELPPPTDIVVGKKLTLHSAILNENRESGWGGHRWIPRLSA